MAKINTSLINTDDNLLKSKIDTYSKGSQESALAQTKYNPNDDEFLKAYRRSTLITDYNNSRLEQSKKYDEIKDLYGMFYTGGVSYDKDGNAVKAEDPTSYTEKYQFAEFLHELYPELSVEYFMSNAEDFMYSATGIKTDVKSYSDHLGRIWNAAWANAGNSLASISDYLGAFVSGKFNTEEFDAKKELRAKKNSVSGANYRKDLGDEKYDSLFQKMLSGTWEQAPQMAIMLALSALSLGAGGISGFMASKAASASAKGLATASKWASLAAKTASLPGKAKIAGNVANFFVSGLMDAGSLTSELSQMGVSDEASFWAGMGVLVSTGFLETWGDETLLKPVEKVANSLFKIKDAEVVNIATKKTIDIIKDMGIATLKEVGKSEITETTQEELEYISETFAKYLVAEYEAKYGNMLNREELGITKEEFIDGFVETAKQTMLSTPFMTLGANVVSSGFDVVLGETSFQWTPKKYQNKEGSTNIVRSDNVVMSNVKVDSSKADGENGKANPIKAHVVGSYIVLDEDLSTKQNELLQSGRPIFITETESRVMTTNADTVQSSAVNTGTTLSAKEANSYLVALDQSGKLESYGFLGKEKFTDKAKRTVTRGERSFNSDSDGANSLYIKLKGQDAPLRIAISEKNSGAESLSTLEKITGVKYEDFQTAEAKEQDVQKRAEEIRTQEQDERKAEENKETKETTEEKATGDKPADADYDPLEEVTEDLDESPADSPDTPKGETVATQALNKLNKVDPEPVRKRISYKEFDFKGKKANNKTYTVEFYTENGQPTNDYNTAKIYGMRESNGRITYVDASKISEAKREELLTLTTNNPLAKESTGNNDTTVKSVIDDNKRTEEAKNAVGVESTAEKVETVAKRDEKAKEEASKTTEVKTEETQTPKEATTETADTTTANEPKAVEESKTEETAETPEPVKEREFNVGVDTVQKETNSTTSEAQDATLTATAMKEVVEQATGKKKTLSDVLKKINKKFVKDLATSNSPEERASVAAKAIAEIDGFESVLKKIYGKDTALNESTKQDFVNDFVNYINGTGENISENAKIVFDKLSSGVLATYLNDVERNEPAIQKLEGTTAEPQTAEQMAQEAIRQEQENAEQKKEQTQQTQTQQTEATEKAETTETEKTADTSKKQTFKEWWNSVSRPQQIAYNLSVQAVEYYEYQARVASTPENQTKFKNYATIYRKWANQIRKGDINTAYEYLSSYDNLVFERKVAQGNTYTSDEGKEKTLKFRTGYAEDRRTAMMAEEVAEYYTNQKRGQIVTFGELNTMAISSYAIGKMNTALREGIDNYFKDILTYLTGEKGGIASETLGTLSSEEYRLKVLDFLEQKSLGDVVPLLNTITDELKGIDMTNIKDRDVAIKNNGKLEKAYTTLISKLLYNDFITKFPETEDGKKYSIKEMSDYIRSWNNLAPMLTDSYSDMSLLRGWQIEEKYREALKKVQEETDNDKIRLEERDLNFQNSINEQEREGVKSNSALISSSFRYDTEKGKYYITDNVQREVFQVVSASIPNMTEEQASDIRKTAVFATAFLTSLDEDIQDELVRKSLRHSGDKFLVGDNENMLRLFFNFNDLKDQSSISKNAIGASLTESAKIILGANSNESTIVHESGHIIYNLDPSIRQTAKEAYTEYFKHDTNGDEIRAVVLASPDRFGGMTADEVINNLKAITREDYDYLNEAFKNTEESIMYMLEAHDEGRDTELFTKGNEKVEYSSGIKGLLERISNIVKKALDTLKRIFHVDFLENANDKVYGSFFTNPEEAKQFFKELRAQSREEITLPMRANSIEARALSPSLSVNDRIAPQTVASSIKEAHDGTAVRDDYQSRQQFEELTYVHVISDEGGNEIVSKWRSGLKDTFATENDITRLQTELQNSGFFYELENQNVSAIPMEEIKRNVAERIAYSTEDYLAFAEKLGQIKDSLRDSKGNLVKEGSPEYNEAMYRLYGYRDITEDGVVNHRAVGLLSKLYMNDPRGRFGRVDSETGQLAKTVKENLRVATQQAEMNWFNYEELSALFDRKLAQYSDNTSYRNVKKNNQYNTRGLKFNTNISTELLESFLNALVRKQGDDYVPRAWKSKESATGFGNYIQGPLIDLVNNAHLDSSAMENGFARNSLTNTNDMFIKAAYNNYNKNVTNTINESMYLSDTVTKDFIGAIKQLDGQDMLKGLYGMKLDMNFYEQIEKLFNEKAEKSEATTQALQQLHDALEAGASFDTVTDVVRLTSLRKAEEAVKADTSTDQADSKKALAEVKRDLISTVNELNAERQARLQEREAAAVFLAHYETENEDLKKELNKANSKLATADRRYEKALANAFTQISQSNIEEIKNNKDAQAVLTAYTAVLNNLRTENKNLTKELENAKALADKALKESTNQTTIAQAVLKDFTEKGVVPLFTEMVDNIRDKARSGGTKRVSEKLTALMNLIGTRVPVKSIRTINTKEVFNFREIYTSDISPENYDKYIKNVTDLGMWVKKNMLTATSDDGIYVVSKSVWDLNAEQLVKLQSLISKVNDDSVKYYKEMVKADEEYNAKWVKQIVQELKDYAEIKGKNMNELLVEDSLGTKDAQKGLKSKIGEFANDFYLTSTKYRERFPTLYAYLYGGVDHKGQLWQGLNGNFNDLNREVRKRNDKLSNLLVSELSDTIFYKGKLTEKNLRRNFEELKNGYSTTLGEDVLTDEDKNSVGLHIDEYVQNRKTKRVASVDEDSDSALKVVVKYLADKEIELQKTQDSITETNDWITENENKINGIRRSIDKLNSQIAILEKAENIQNGGVMMDEDRHNTIKALQEKITNYKTKIEKIEKTNEDHREKLLTLQDDYNKISNIGKRPNANMAKYTTQELLGIYMFARQQGGLDHLLFDPSKVDNVMGSVTNNLSIGNVLWVINKFEKDDAFKPLRRVADGMSDIISSKFEQVRDVRYFMTNGQEWMKQEDYYFSFTSDNSEMYDYGSELDLGIFDKPAEAKPEAQSRLAKAGDQFTKDRHRSLRALNLGVLDYAYNSIYKQEYYINMAKSIKNLKALVANEDFQTAMKNAYGRKDGIKQLRSLGKYVNQLGNTQTDINENVLSKAMRFITANTAVAAMAYRLPSVLQQFPTMLYVLREKHIGLGGMLKALYRATTDKTLYQYSPQMQEIAESSVAYIRKTKNLGTMLGNYTLSKAITMTQDVGLALLDKANGYIANAMWYAYFEGVKQEYIENGKADGLSTDEFIQLCANEATQRVLDITPTQQAKDNSAIYATNNAFVRDLLLFTNQTSKMLNGIASSWKDKDIVKGKFAKTMAVTLATVMLNAIISGQMFRKTKDDDDDEAKVHLLKNIPYAAITGFTDLLPISLNILSSDKYGSTDLPVDIQNLFKVIKKDKDDRTEHQLANAIANFVTDSMGLMGLPSTETRSIYRGFRDGVNPGYWYNTKYGELFEKED